MFILKIRALAIAGACLVFGTFSTPALAEWRVAKSPHFLVYGDQSENELRIRTERLERYDAMMRMLFKVQDTVPVSIFVLPSLSDVRKYAKGQTNSRNVAGFYSADAQLAYAFVPENLPDRSTLSAQQVLFHEYAHHMLLGSLDLVLPGWANEGLAEFFMTSRLNRDGSITVGIPNDARAYALFNLSRWSVKDLMESDNHAIPDDEIEQKYARGWALIHYLWLSGKRPGQYAKFVDLLNRDGDPMKAAKEAFGDLDKLNRELNAYLRTTALPVSEFTSEQLKAPTDVTVRALRPGEAAILPFRMESLLGVTDETAPELEQDAKPVAAQYPDDPFVARTMAEIEFDAKNYKAAKEAAERGLKLDPKNLMAMAYLGRVDAQDAIANNNDAADWDAARSQFLKANRMDPNHPLPFELYFDSFVAEGKTPPADAVQGLFRAVVLMPQDESLRSRAAVELIRAGNIKRARSVIAPVAFNPHAPQDNPARKLVEQIDAKKSKAELIAYLEKTQFLERRNDFLARKFAKEDEGKDGSGKDGSGKDQPVVKD